MIASAWLIHAFSWFLPVLKLGNAAHSELFGPVSLRGWPAFRVALSPLWPYEGVHIDAWYYSVLAVLSAATTFLFIVGSPWIVWRGSKSVQKASAWIAAVAFLTNSHWYILFGPDRKDLSVGYFLWWLSFSLLAIGLFGLSYPSPRRQGGPPHRTKDTADDSQGQDFAGIALGSRWEAAGKPVEGWVWPAPSKSGHLEPSSLKKQHAKALKLSKVRPFVLYSLRHTFLTRLGASGCDVWTLARIAGHSSVGISARYVHPSEDAVLSAVEKLGGHKIGHNEVGQGSDAVEQKQLSA